MNRNLFSPQLQSNLLFEVIILFLTISDCVYVNSTTISKCFFDGDYTVYCNKSKIAVTSSPKQNNAGSGGSDSNGDALEVMRYARVINGLQYNETLCSYLPGSGCHRRQNLAECVDQTFCHVKNSWFSLEPECRGNSYYTQLEYDCQPAYHMCQKESINAFSGLIYSPAYPNSFRSDRIEPCYLTVNVPKDHHVEIVIDAFDLIKTPGCIGDFLEIQQYTKIKPSNSANSNDEYKLFISHKKQKQQQQTGVSSQKSFNNFSDSSFLNQPKIVKKQQRLNNRPQKIAPKYEWQKLVSLCGKLDRGNKILAMQSTINFKFRALPSTHSYVSRMNTGFKIFFQAIPSIIPEHFADETTTNITPSTNKPTNNNNNNANGIVITTKNYDLNPYSHNPQSEEGVNSGGGVDSSLTRRRTILNSNAYFYFT
jgi:hypothetical protein